MAWIVSLMRTADPNYVSGAGSFLALVSGSFLIATCRTTLAEFRRGKVYAGDEEHPDVEPEPREDRGRRHRRAEPSSP